MTIIYEPKGRAGEYAPLAVNTYISCTHNCKYCYAKNIGPFRGAEKFHAQNCIRQNAIKKLKKDAAKYRGDEREILFCFLGDPYNPDEPKNGITRQAIEIMMENNLRFTVLTKGGARVRRDLDLFSQYPKCSIGQTIVFSDQASVDFWEPNAAPLKERFDLAKEAHDAGIKTWVSLEPVIDPDQALEVVNRLHPYVDLWKVGPVNYVSGINVDWAKFKFDIETLFQQIGANYILKEGLIKKAAA